MKIFILCFAVVFLQICGGEIITKVPPKKPHSECGVAAGGYIIQRITTPLTLPANLHWSHHLQKLYFVDEKNYKVCIYDINKGELAEIVIDKLKGIDLRIVIPIKGHKNTYWLVTKTDIKVLELLYKDDLVTGYNLEEHKPISQEKDLIVAKGRTDCEGRLLYGTFKTESSKKNYTELTMVQKQEDPVAIYKKGDSTLLAFDKDYKKIYVLSGNRNIILQFEYNAKAGYLVDIDDPPVVFDTAKHQHEIEGKIADFILDTDGKLWIAFMGTGLIIKYNCETNEIELKVIIPEHKVTGMTWGSKKMNILFVTTMSYLLDTKVYPNAGSVYAVSGLKSTGVKYNDIVP